MEQFNFTEAELKGAELDQIDNFILAGLKPEAIQEKYPHYGMNEINKMYEHVAKHCWYEEWRIFIIPLALKRWIYNESGECISELLKKSFSEFYLTKKLKSSQQGRNN